MKLVRAVLMSVLVLGLAASTARGDYILNVESVSGGTSVWVDPGASFGVNLMLESDASDQSTTAIFDILFSDPGLEYLSYSWAAPYVTGGTDDVSVPLSSELPVTLSAATYTRGAAGAVDVHLDNFLDSGTFGEGLLAQLTLAVPSGWSAGTVVDIWADPDPGGFASGVGPPFPITTSAGTGLEVHVTPEPGTAVLALLGLAVGTAVRRRRKGQH